MHRHEPSGTLHGLMRVRHITQDDAHIFCTHEQIEDEVIGCLELAQAIYGIFQLDLRIELSTRPEKRIGGDELWDAAEAALHAGARAGRGGVRAERGRRRVLRAQDRPAHDRLDRPLVADGHDPARFPDAGAVRHHLHRRGQRRAHAGDDPPRAVRLVRALHRHPDRALRGRVPGLAGAGAGAGGAGRGPPQRLRPSGGGRAERGRPAGRGGHARRVGGKEDRGGRAAEDAADPGRR